MNQYLVVGVVFLVVIALLATNKKLVETLKNIYKIEELRKRVIYTIGLLLVYRLGSFVVIPGINPNALGEGSAYASQLEGNGLLGLLNVFSGGAFGNAAILALGVMPYITASIIISIQSSVVISLGMVGALSIVRFRTAVKDPMDLAYMFWTISVGIICGAGLFEVAVEASILITIVMLLLHFVPNAKPALLLLVNGTDSKIQAELEQVLKDGTRVYKIKSRNMTGTGIDMIVELKTKDEGALMEKVLAIPAVESATLMPHDGEVTY